MKYRKNQDVGLFDKEDTLQELLKNGNPLPKLKEIIDFEQFRSVLEPVFENTGKKSNAGRKPFDPVFMFRVLFLQRLYGLSDAQIEYHIKDRTSFRDFLGIQSVDDVPDGKTVWKYGMKEVCPKAILLPPCWHSIPRVQGIKILQMHFSKQVLLMRGDAVIRKFLRDLKRQAFLFQPLRKLMVVYVSLSKGTTKATLR